MFKNIYGICLLVENFERSLVFYRDVLNLKIKVQEERFAEFDLKGTSLAIFQKDEATVLFPADYMRPAGGVILAFQVKNIENVCKKLERKGLEIFEGPKKTPWGQKVAYFKDPDGNVWEISEIFKN